MTSEELKKRTKQFALDNIRLVEIFPKSPSSEIIARQLIRSATSVGANYRSACRARSKPDFISKITIAEEEADECMYWLELLIELQSDDHSALQSLLKEANKLTATFASSAKTARSELSNPKS